MVSVVMLLLTIVAAGAVVSALAAAGWMAGSSAKKVKNNKARITHPKKARSFLVCVILLHYPFVFRGSFGVKSGCSPAMPGRLFRALWVIDRGGAPPVGELTQHVCK
jgi:hypothetical protein